MNSRFFAAIVLGFLFVSSVVRAEEGKSKWLTDYETAVKEAKETQRPILLNFTGSDWCTWCIKLDKETFSKPEFAAFAKDHLVLLEVDFPQGKEQSAELAKQNEGLQQKFGVEGFPTLVLLSGDGKELARNVGYLQGGPAGLMAWVKDALAAH